VLAISAAGLARVQIKTIFPDYFGINRPHIPEFQAYFILEKTGSFNLLSRSGKYGSTALKA
jgi:hypothetical protein